MTETDCEKISELAASIEPLVYTKAEAAKMLSLPESSIDWMLRKQAIPHRKIAGKIRFTRSDIETLIEASAVTQCCATYKESEVKYE